MPELDPSLSRDDVYQHRSVQQLRISDLDQLGHVNNLNMAFMLQDGRARFFRDMNMWPFSDHGSGHLNDFHDRSRVFMIVNQTFDYVGEAVYPDELTIFTAISTVSRSTFTVAQLAKQNGKPVALCSCTMVQVADGRAVELESGFRSKLETLRFKNRPIIV